MSICPKCETVNPDEHRFCQYCGTKIVVSTPLSIRSEVEVFISYVQEDESLYEELEKHLKTLQRQNLIAKLHDREIVAGTDFKDEIDSHLNRAGIILLLVSPDYIASDHHWTVEVTRALERNISGKACVIPVLLRSTEWKMPPIDKLSPLPRNGKPVKGSYWSDRDEAFLEVVTGIREEIARLTENPSYLVKEQVITAEAETREKQATIFLNQADKLHEQRKFEEAAVKYREALQYNPENALAQNRLGVALADLGKLDEAIAAYHQAIQLSPNYANAHVNLGLALYCQGKLDEAITMYKKTLQLNTNEVNQHLCAYNNLGTALIDKGELDEAITAFRNAIQLDPDLPISLSNLGLALREQGKLDEAITAFRQAIQVFPNFASPYIHLGDILSEQEKSDEAIPLYCKAGEIDPSRPEPFIGIGKFYLNFSQFDKAITAFQCAIQVDPECKEAHDYLAMAYCNLGAELGNEGELDEAITAFRQAIQIDPECEEAHDNLASALRVQGQKKKFFGLF